MLLRDLRRRSGAPPRFSREGKLELTEAPWSKTRAERIPEGFRSAESGRVDPGGAGANSIPHLPSSLLHRRRNRLGLRFQFHSLGARSLGPQRLDS
jgi:hypothetical protein